MAKKLLIVDDSRILHPLVRLRLAGEELDFYSAFDGKSGLDMARKILPDIILLDVEMPAPTGFEVCDSLKADRTTADIPVIFITGSASTEDKIKGLNKGAVDYVTKPFEPAELVARVRSALRTKHLVELLAETALTDGLTGLRNRGYLERRLVAEISLARRDLRPLACAMADLDQFRRLNDERGHVFGDRILQQTADLFRCACRAEDILCRYGGEEFAMLFPGTALEGACKAADRFRRSLVENGSALGASVTASFGVAQYEPDEPPHGLLARADRALHRAKSDGRNVVFPHFNTEKPVTVHAEALESPVGVI